MLYLVIKIASIVGLLVLLVLAFIHLLPWLIGPLIVVGVVKLGHFLFRRNPNIIRQLPTRWPWKE